MNGRPIGCSESQAARVGWPAGASGRAGARWLWFAARLVGGLGLLVLACTPAGGGATASKPAASTSAPAPPPATVSSAPAAGSAASTAPTAPAAPVALTVGAVSPNALLWTLYVAQGKGFLEREGVQLDLTYTGSTASATQSLVAGSVDLGNGSIDNFVRAIESGAQLVAVVGEQAPPTYSLLGQPSIASIAD